jgi:hypothetical protein
MAGNFPAILIQRSGLGGLARAIDAGARAHHPSEAAVEGRQIIEAGITHQLRNLVRAFPYSGKIRYYGANATNGGIGWPLIDG